MVPRLQSLRNGGKFRLDYISHIVFLFLPNKNIEKVLEREREREMREDE